MTESIGIEEFTDLADTGITITKSVPPEEEFFKSVYITGKERKNHIGTTEQSGKLQVRGKDYNLDEVNMVITNVKKILVKNIKNSRGFDSVDCFCFMEGEQPYTSTSGRTCGATRGDRDTNEFCVPCRSQIIVAGLYCEPSGKPIMDGSAPVFCFVRANGIKYSNVSEYLNDMSEKDLTPLFQPSTEETIKKEKIFVNNKRFVTNIKVEMAQSDYGEARVFKLVPGTELPGEKVMDILKLAKKVQPKFVDKFDWSKKQSDKPRPDGVLGFDDAKQNPAEQPAQNQEANTTNQPPVQQDFSFDEIEF